MYAYIVPVPAKHKPAGPQPLARLKRRALSQPRVRRWRHQRNLRTARWARTTMAEAHRAFLTTHWKPFSGVVVGAIAAAVALVRWVPGGPTVRGFAAGLLVTGTASALWLTVMSSTGTAAKQMGVDAETWTAAELRRLRRSGWTALHGFPLDWGDVDHVLVGNGRVLALETKWSATPWDLDGSDPRIAGAVDQVLRGAERVQKYLGTVGVSAKVRGIVVLWGPVASRVPKPAVRGRNDERVAVLHGSMLKDFVAAVEPHDVDVAAASDALATQIERNDAHLARTKPSRPSLRAQGTGLFAGSALSVLVVFALTTLAIALFGAKSRLADVVILIGLSLATVLALIAERRAYHRPVVGGFAVSLLAFVALLAVRVA